MGRIPKESQEGYVPPQMKGGVSHKGTLQKGFKNPSVSTPVCSKEGD